MERQHEELTAHFNTTFRQRLQIHLEKFKQEAKKLRLQLGAYKREFSSRDTTFLKLRNACAAQEFTFIQLKKYLTDQNMRMVYKVMGLAIPKKVKDKLLKGGADFSDYFPQRANTKPCHNVYKGALGLIEDKPPATDEELIEPGKKKKEVETPFAAELDAAMMQHRMEY